MFTCIGPLHLVEIADALNRQGSHQNSRMTVSVDLSELVAFTAEAQALMAPIGICTSGLLFEHALEKHVSGPLCQLAACEA